MRKLAELIVNNRKLLMVIFIAAAIGSAIMSSHVEVVQELTDYLPEDTETRQGVDLMDAEFTTFGTAKVMISNVTYEEAKDIVEQLKDIKGVSAVDFYEESDEDETEITDGEELSDYYKNLSALLSITFDTPEDDPEAQGAIKDVREALADYDTWFYTTVDKDDNASSAGRYQGHSGDRCIYYYSCSVVYIRNLYGDCYFHACICHGGTPEYGYQLYIRKDFFCYQCSSIHFAACYGN